jgi:UDP-glucose 4-epimerase
MTHFEQPVLNSSVIKDVGTAPVRRRVVVFGGDGFLGSYFVEQLVALGHEVTVLDRFRGGKAKNIGRLSGRCRWLAGDASAEDSADAALEGQDMAAVLISASSPLGAWSAPLGVIDVELRQTVRLFDRCARHGVRKIVFVSSGGTIYGPQPGRLDEDVLPRPRNPYGIAKLAEEHFLRFYADSAGIAADCYRIGNLYGPRQPLDRDLGVIAAWTGRILTGRHVDVYGGEVSVRDYVYVEDAARLMTHSLRDVASGEVYNLGTGRGTTLLQLLAIFKSVCGQPFEIHHHPRRPSDNTSAVLNSAKLLRHFPGFSFLSLKEGVERTFAWAREARGG